MIWPLKIQGRFLTEVEVTEVLELLRDHPSWNRSRLSRELCMRWNWRRPDGQIKDMACRELLRKLEARGLIKLPPRQNYGVRRVAVIEPVEIDQTPLSCRLSDVSPVSIVNIRECSKYAKTFNHLMKEYHYLSYQRPVGQNMKYMMIGRDKQILGCLLFGAAAWKIIDRDLWVGWSVDVRERNLGLICNNTRFLILDWVHIPHLASHVLGACMRRLSRDWLRYYGTEVAMVETFVDTTRYAGTCYKAANWIHLGQTQGRSRQDRENKLKVPVKDILVYPLRRDFRKVLLA